MALVASGAISASDINIELGKAAGSTFSWGSSNARNLSDVVSGAISLASFYTKSLIASFTGELWRTRNTAGSMVYSMGVDTGIKTSGIYPKTINMYYAGHQQDSSCQQMQRTITAYPLAGGSNTGYNVTSALCDWFGTTGAMTLNGLIEVNRISAYATGKVGTGTVLDVWISSWNAKKFVVV